MLDGINRTPKQVSIGKYLYCGDIRKNIVINNRTNPNSLILIPDKFLNGIQFFKRSEIRITKPIKTKGCSL
jgi:hypothetical protein